MNDIELLGEPTTALTVTARAELALGSDKARKELAALVKKSAAIKEVKNAAGRDEAHGAAMVLVRARTTIQKTGKAARDDATQFSKAVIAEEKELIAITQGEEDRLLALRNTWDEARAAEKAEAERIERERVMNIGQRIADIRECAVLASQCRTAAAVTALIDKLAADPMQGFEEFSDEAEGVRTKALASMREISGNKMAQEQQAAREKAEREAEAQRLADERAQLAKERAEQAERERVAKAEQAEAHHKALAEAAAAQLALNARRAEQEAELQRQRDMLAAEHERFSAEVATLRREQEAARQAEADRIAAEQPKVAPLLESDPIFNQEDGGELLDARPGQQDDLDGPSDGEIIAVAVTAVAAAFACTTDAAINRLAEIQEWIVAEVAN